MNSFQRRKGKINISLGRILFQNMGKTHPRINGWIVNQLDFNWKKKNKWWKGFCLSWINGVCVYSPSWNKQMNKQKEPESDIYAYIFIFIHFPCILTTYCVPETEAGAECTVMSQGKLLLSSLKSGAGGRQLYAHRRKQTWATSGCLWSLPKQNR